VLRKVKGKVERINGEAWGGLEIEFRLHPGSYDRDNKTNYPQQTFIVKTAVNGTFETNLWCNESKSGLPTTYKCVFRGDKKDGFLFTLPSDSNADIDLATLRARGVILDPINNNPDEPDTGVVSPSYREMFVPQLGQTVFVLTKEPTKPHLSLFTVNGVKALYPVDYRIDKVTLTWLRPMFLDNTDIVEVVYQ
jgi:hypothetical protein